MRTLAFIMLISLAAPAWSGPSPAPAASELDGLIEKLPAADPAESFSRLEEFVQAEDQPDPRTASRDRARKVLARFADLLKNLPPPPEKLAGEVAQLLFTVGRALEEGGATAEALPVYERIIKDYPKAVWEGGLTKEPIANQATARLRWHKEKHPWLEHDTAALIAKLRAAFSKHDKPAMAALIARIGFWSGPFASEGGADDPDRVLKLLDAGWPKDDKLTIAADIEAFSDKDKQVFLKVSGFTAPDFAELYLILERESDGWGWSGVAFAAKPLAEPAEAAPEASATPAASPKPKPSAK